MISLDQHTCPRCLGGIPNDTHRGLYVGALSRTDNKTMICSSCGTHEALEDFTGTRTTQENWAIAHQTLTEKS